MISGLLALLDDIAAVAKVTASSLDDASALAAKAGSKAAGIVIDDAAVTPRYVVGLAAEREVPIIIKITKGSLKNKLLILLPGALVLSLLAPWAITPLLMAGGAYLCFEGYHKVMEMVHPGHHLSSHDEEILAMSAEELENMRVGSAVRTDFILSAEIMAITLAGVAGSSLWMQAVVLAVVGLCITLLVYGVVALIVKADDAGVAMARSGTGLIRATGRAIVFSMPTFMKILSFIGMIAMLWVGGGILIHGLHELGLHAPEELVQHAADSFAGLAPSLDGQLRWLGQAGISAILGILVGALVNPLVNHVIQPLMVLLRSGVFKTP